MKIWVASLKIPLFSGHLEGPWFDDVVGVFTSADKAMKALESEIKGTIHWHQNDDLTVDSWSEEQLYYGDDPIESESVFIEAFEIDEIERASDVIVMKGH